MDGGETQVRELDHSGIPPTSEGRYDHLRWRIKSAVDICESGDPRGIGDVTKALESREFRKAKPLFTLGKDNFQDSHLHLKLRGDIDDLTRSEIVKALAWVNPAAAMTTVHDLPRIDFSKPQDFIAWRAETDRLEVLRYIGLVALNKQPPDNLTVKQVIEALHNDANTASAVGKVTAHRFFAEVHQAQGKPESAIGEIQEAERILSEFTQISSPDLLPAQAYTAASLARSVFRIRKDNQDHVSDLEETGDSLFTYAFNLMAMDADIDRDLVGHVLKLAVDSGKGKSQILSLVKDNKLKGYIGLWNQADVELRSDYNSRWEGKPAEYS